MTAPRPAPLPSLAALRAFEAASRTLSFSEAGREMNVSHAAVAQNVRRLEDELGRGGFGSVLLADLLFLDVLRRLLCRLEIVPEISTRNRVVPANPV